jgi:hypothetical protein
MTETGMRRLGLRYMSIITNDLHYIRKMSMTRLLYT